MCPIVSDLKAQSRPKRRANRSSKPSCKQCNASAEKKPLSKNAYRKQRKASSRQEMPATAASTPKKREAEKNGKRHNAKQSTPTVVVAATPTLGSYLPSVSVLYAISLIIGLVILIRSKQ